MEFFIFLCFMSFVSFAVAFLAYGLVIRLMGTTSSASRYSQIILVPIAIIGYDFLTITAPAEYRYVCLLYTSDAADRIPLFYRRPADAAFRINAAVLPFW